MMDQFGSESAIKNMTTAKKSPKPVVEVVETPVKVKAQEAKKVNFSQMK
jgi:hypothetical protein